MNRAYHLRDMLAAIEEFWRSEGPERDYWRGIALCRIAAFRSRFLNPERAAFEAAVRNHQHRKAA
jgi:hypothetical protein